MASALKRKRGLVAVKDSSKRAKSIEADIEPASQIDNSKISWDAAFGEVKKGGVSSKDNRISNSIDDEEPETEDFHEFVDKADASSELVKEMKKDDRNIMKWKSSNSIGGRMLDIDPVFTKDEKFLIVAQRRTIKVYATSNSLLNRSIDIVTDQTRELSVTIMALALSPSDSTKIWVACSDGRIFNIDWTTGTRITEFCESKITFLAQMTVVSIGPSERKRDFILTAAEIDGLWTISVHDLSFLREGPAIQSRTLYTSPQAIQIMKIVGEEHIIVAAAGKNIAIGALKSSDFERVEQMRYEFMVFESPEAISSLDARASTRSSDTDILYGRLRASKAEFKVIDVVAGDAKGSIFVHSDLLGNFHRSQVKLPNGQPLQQSAFNLTPRKLHWHRKSVPAAKWSLDGNYIISGGSETTLVLWQLDTGHQQFLPHLSSAIANIVVSPSGTSYAVHLADNSTMILSTSELIPTANIAGIQAHVLQQFEPIGSSVKRLKEPARERPLVPRTRAVINPSIPSRLILAVGDNQAIDPRSTAPFSTQYLQTFDIASNHNISRQAMTRTNVTNINISPNALPISEPIITLMQISPDGLWLATVDEWVPPKRDVESLGYGKFSVTVEQLRRREVHLKFWQWQKSDETWALVDRIDSPHSTQGDSYGSGRVLGLAADSKSTTFSTIGDDGVVLVWRSRIRKRDGVAVRGDNGEPISTWKCQRRISLGNSALKDDSFISEKGPEHASLAFSEDGSILAAATSGNDDCVIHLIDPFTGFIRISRPITYRGDLINMAFLGQYLIILSDDLRVHDLVLDEITYGIELEEMNKLLSLNLKVEMTHLAVDRKSRTFAVALPCRRDWNLEDKESMGSIVQAYSEIAIFTPKSAAPLYAQTWPAMATAVVPAISSAGYIIIDSAAEITSLAPSAIQTLISISKPMVELRLDLRNEDVPGKSLMGLIDDVEEQHEVDEMDLDEVMDDGEGPPVVSQQQLARIFDAGPAFTLPPIEEMFYRVADLFSNKAGR